MMKKLFFVLILFPIMAFAQQDVSGTTKDTTDNKIIVSEDVNDCINRIHDNPAAIKLFLRNLAQDPEKMRETYKKLANDPEVRRLVEQIRNNFHSDKQMDQKQ